MNTILIYSICLVISIRVNHGQASPVESSLEMAEEKTESATRDIALHDKKMQLNQLNNPEKNALSSVLNNLKFKNHVRKTFFSNSMNDSVKGHSSDKLTQKSDQTFIVPSKQKTTYQFKSCLYRTKSLYKCIYQIYNSKHTRHLTIKSPVIKLKGRRLLSINSDNVIAIPKRNVNNTENKSTNTSNSTDLLNELALEEYEEFVKALRQTFSKDPLHAMLSVCFLMFVLMLAIKCCGLRQQRPQREIPPEYDGGAHYVSIYEILKMRRPYLPKNLLRWERRLRRKYKRKKRIQKEQDVVEVLSDNSAEESLIYSRDLDF